MAEIGVRGFRQTSQIGVGRASSADEEMHCCRLSSAQRPASSAREGTRLANGDSDASTISGRIGEGVWVSKLSAKHHRCQLSPTAVTLRPPKADGCGCGLRPKARHGRREDTLHVEEGKRETVLRLARIARFQPNFPTSTSAHQPA